MRAGIAVIASLVTAACTAAPGASPPIEPTTAISVVTTTTPPSTTSTTAVPVPTTATTSPVTTTTVDPEPEVLAVGVAGPRVAALQQRLIDLHFDPGPVDGRFGSKTRMAVWAFQHLQGEEADGTVTPALWDALQVAGPPPPLRPDGGATRVEIDIARQVLLLYRDGALRLVTHVSTGSGKHYCEEGHCGTAVTPRGDYAFTWRYPGWRHSYLGELYNPLYFNGGIAVHGATSVPNYPASHGCVRIPMHIAEYLPGLVEHGDPVYVV